MPDGLKIVVIFMGILILIRFRVALNVTLLGSAAVQGLLFQMPLSNIALGFFNGALDPETLLLTAGLLFILFSAPS